MSYTFIVEENSNQMRIDQFLANMLKNEASREKIQEAIELGLVILNDEKIIKKPSVKILQNDKIQISFPTPKKIELIPTPLNLQIIYETENYLLIHKPFGLATHPGVNDSSVTLVHGLIHQFPYLNQLDSKERPGIVHRLDKFTEGILLVSKNIRATSKLSELFLKREIKKTYIGWMIGKIKNLSGTISEPITRHPVDRLKMHVHPNGRKAITHYKVLKTIHSKKDKIFNKIEIQLETGRTHQIRVHFSHLKTPIVGDTLYRKNDLFFEKYGMLLFASALEFIDPFSLELVSKKLELPERFLIFEKKCKEY